MDNRKKYHQARVRLISLVVGICLNSTLSYSGSTTVSLSGSATGFLNPAYITPGNTSKVVTWMGVSVTCSKWTGTLCDEPKIMVTDTATFAGDMFSFHKNLWISPYDANDFCYFASMGSDNSTPITSGTSSWSSNVLIVSVGFGGARPSTTNGPFTQDLGSVIRYFSVIDIAKMNPPHHPEYPGPYSSNFGYAYSLSDGSQFNSPRIECNYW